MTDIIYASIDMQLIVQYVGTTLASLFASSSSVPATPKPPGGVGASSLAAPLSPLIFNHPLFPLLLPTPLSGSL